MMKSNKVTIKYRKHFVMWRTGMTRVLDFGPFSYVVDFGVGSRLSFALFYFRYPVFVEKPISPNSTGRR